MDPSLLMYSKAGVPVGRGCQSVRLTQLVYALKCRVLECYVQGMEHIGSLSV